MPLSDKLVAEVLAADRSVIAIPVYNFQLAGCVEDLGHTVRESVAPSHDGKGLVTEKATVLIALSGIYTEGSPIRDRGIATQYLKLIRGVIGITEVTIVAGGGAKAVDVGEQTMDGFIATVAPQITEAAA